MSGPAPILFVNLGEDWITGTEQVLLDLVRGLDPARFSPVVWCNAPTLASACEAAGIPVHHSRFGYFLAAGSSRLDLRRYFGFVATGRALVQRHGIRLIHSNGAGPLQFCVPLARFEGIPLVGHLHADESRRSRYVFLSHLADVAVGVSRQTVAGLAEDGMPPARLRVIRNGVDAGRFAPAAAGASLRASLGIPPDALLIGSVGSLIHRKGHGVLVEAFGRIAAREPRLHLAIAGGGPERDAIAAQVAREGLDGRVHLAGPMADPSPLYRDADIFALASRSEALPLVLIEASLFGLPCVATDVGGTAEAVLHERTGLLVPSEDGGALAAALQRLASDPALRRSFGGAARAHATRGFGLSAMVTNFESLYTELLDPERRRALGGGRSRLAPYLRGGTGTRPPNGG